MAGPSTYGVFLWHGLVITVYGSRHPDAAFNLSFLRMALFVIPIVVLLAALTWGLVQRPSLTYLDRRLPTFAAGMWGIGIAGLLWRLVSVLHITTVRPDGGDPFYYHIQAGLLSAGRGFSEPFRWTMDGTLEPTAIHPPLYSMYLSISSFLGADTYLAHKTLSIVAGVGVVVVIGLIARRLGGDWAGWIAAALAAFYPQFWIVDGILWSEGLFTLFIALTVWAAFRLQRSAQPVGRRGLGLAVSGAVLTRARRSSLARCWWRPWCSLVRTRCGGGAALGRRRPKAPLRRMKRRPASRWEAGRHGRSGPSASASLRWLLRFPSCRGWPAT
ncbi:MAG: glycosyltransferase family 39 protein [Candidatus Microthrix sp.]|nr:glycosyltransferase family 39 protein [Candidatus Microthrix sp.]MBK7322607.1 glycosyltransferase family 39 protein [Candidatus Microthrix sp.]